MKKFRILIVLLLIGTAALAQNILAYINTANSFFDTLDLKEYTKAQDFFDASVKDKVSPENLEKMWTQMQNSLGKFESVDGAQNKVQGEFQIVILKCKFTNDTQSFQFVFNESQKLVGFFILPKQASSSYKLPIYADTTKYTEKLINIPSGEHSLPAMLTMPKDSVNVPIVVFVHGSGPADMDESVGAQKPFKDLAVGLASKGVASIRYVKRTAIYAGEFKGAFTTKEEVTDDAIAVLNYSKKVSQVDSQKVYLFGHSLGGMLAPKIASQETFLKGIILAAAPARKLQDLSIEQNNYFLKLSDDTTKAGKVALDQITKELNSSKTISKTSIAQDSVILGLPASYWADLNAMNQIEIAKKLNTRIFIIQGGNDFQVTLQDYYLWTSGLKGKKMVDSKIYPMVNHLFSFVNEKGNTQQYQEPLHVDQPVVDDLASWILQK